MKFPILSEPKNCTCEKYALILITHDVNLMQYQISTVTTSVFKQDIGIFPKKRFRAHFPSNCTLVHINLFKINDTIGLSLVTPQLATPVLKPHLLFPIQIAIIGFQIDGEVNLIASHVTRHQKSISFVKPDTRKKEKTSTMFAFLG